MRLNLKCSWEVYWAKSFRHSISQPEPVYQLRYDGEIADNQTTSMVTVKLNWRMNEEMGEHIELLDVKLSDPESSLDPKKVSLKLRTLLDESHWIDSPKLKLGKFNS